MKKSKKSSEEPQDRLSDLHDSLIIEIFGFSCSSLKVLSLKGCNFENHGNVQWNRLRSLTIETCIVDEDVISQIVCGSRQLEVLNLNIVCSDKNLSIQSTSLKKLSMERYFNDDDDDDDDEDDEPSAELRIWSPNLETLCIGGVPYANYSLMNVSSLIDLTLDFGYEICEEDIFGEILLQIFPTIQHVEKVTLSDWCIKVLLGAMKDKHSISPSPNLESLTLNKEYAGDYEHIVDILQIFPELKTLGLLQSKQCIIIPANHVDRFLHYERNLPESFLLQLRTVEITLTKVDNQIIPFKEILLKHASMLQKMTIRGPRVPQLQKVQGMPKSSLAAVELIFADD